jgi:hypothetical protein
MKKIILKKTNNRIQKLNLRKENKDNHHNLQNCTIISSRKEHDLFLKLDNGKTLVAYYWNIFDEKGKKEEWINGKKV